MAGPNKTLKIGGVVLGAIALMASTIGGAIYVSHIESRKAAAAHEKCEGKHIIHKVTIQNDKVVPTHTNAERCDKLVITNLDDKDRYIAFGQHERHLAYDGVSERYVTTKQSLSVTLVQTGNFLFHDHIQEAVGGTFTVR